MVNDGQAFRALEEICRREGGVYRDGQTEQVPSASCTVADENGQMKVGINHHGDSVDVYAGLKSEQRTLEFNLQEMDPDSVYEFGDQIMSDGIRRVESGPRGEWFKVASNDDRLWNEDWVWNVDDEKNF